jgi:glycosyltransferase involved in cell wall biosynthesis
MQPIAEKDIGKVPEPLMQQIDIGASIFLMNSDLSTGGTERQYSLLAKILRNGPFDILLGCMHRRGAFLDGIEPIEEFDVAGSFLTNQALRARRALAKHLRERNVAVAHAFDFYANLMLIPVARWARVPVVIGSLRQLGDLLSPMQQIAQLATFQFCTRVVCNSRAAASRIANAGLRETKIVVIPNGLPEEAFSKFEAVLPHDSAVVRVGLIARMNHPGKNQGLLLQAAPYITKRFPFVEFVLVGDGPYRESLVRLAEKLGVTNRVRFLGERMDIPAVLASLDISVVTSNSESLSNVILESMASGKPVIATRIGGNPELVREGETGLLVPPQDVHALVHALEILLTRPHLRQEMGQEARRVARADFCINRICQRYEQLYGLLLEEKRRKPGETLKESSTCAIGQR